MRVVAMVSPKGGVGKTTLTANLSVLWRASEEGAGRTLVIDLDPQNALRLHFGISPEEPRGLATTVAEGGSFDDAIFQTRYGVDCLPYGRADRALRAEVDRRMREKPDWVARNLAELEYDVVLIDNPPGPNLQMAQAVRASDTVLMAFLSDAASFASLHLMQDYLRDMGPGMTKSPVRGFIVNQLDPLRPLSRDVVDLMRDGVGDDGTVWVVHYDVSVEEALACGEPLGLRAPDSVAIRDMQEIVEWLRTNQN